MLLNKILLLDKLIPFASNVFAISSLLAWFVPVKDCAVLS